MKQIRITSVEPLHDYVVRLTFSDDTVRDVDLLPYLDGEIFEPIRDNMEMFRSVSVEEGSRTISWQNGADIDPYTLYYGLSSEWSDADDEVAAILASRKVGNPALPVVHDREGDMTIN